MADIAKRRAVIGDNGSWVQVERIAAEGLQAHNANGTRGWSGGAPCAISKPAGFGSPMATRSPFDAGATHHQQ
jgi:hypothetical protein